MFELPETTKVNIEIPKKSFENYANASQKRKFTEYVKKIIWLNKLSKETTNLESIKTNEIQLFLIELKQKQKLESITSIIDQAIPYPIIFIIKYDLILYYSTSLKHINPKNEDNAIIDWTFKTDWIDISTNSLCLKLKKNLDSVYENFCYQIVNPNKPIEGIHELAQYDRKLKSLLRERESLIKAINVSKQFNKKVELNLKLKTIEKKISNLN
jgi:hypothetical protein